MTPEEKADFISKWKKMQENNAILYTAPEGIERTLAMAYKSPIEIIHGELETKIENDIMTAVQRYGINVNKEELIKALEYDRKQYEQGYEDARRDYQRPPAKWEAYFEHNGKTYHKCSHCHISTELTLFNNFCPNCGAEIHQEETP